jgi:hypothetical protein
MKLDDRRAAGQIQEMINTPDLTIKGRVSVDILNERGRVIDRQEADNYVNQAMWERYAKWAQRIVWSYGMSATPGVITPTAVYQRDPRVAPKLPTEVVACWSDSTAEDTADVFPMGSVVAWAHRWGQGTPSIRQGIVNPLLCELSEDDIKWVWEWTTTNGNGTFQSVGWRRLYWGAATGTAPLADAATFSRRMYSTDLASTGFSSVSTQVNMVSSSVTTNGAPTFYNADDGRMYLLSGATGSGRLWSVPVTITSGGNYHVGSPMRDDSALAFAAGVGGNNVVHATLQTFAMKRMGTTGDWIACGSTGAANSSRRAVIRRVTPAGSLTWSNANAATFGVESALFDLTWDGTDIYAVGYHVTNGGVHMYKIDPVTGNVTASTAITGLPDYFGTAMSTVGFGLMGIEWDAVRGWMWLSTQDGRIFNVDTSGVWQGVLLTRATASPTTLTLSAPQTAQDTTTYTIANRGSSDVDYVRMATGGDQLTTTLPFNNQVQNESFSLFSTLGTLTQKMITMDGDIWMTSNNGNYNSLSIFGAMSFTKDANFASRSLLGAPVTKTSSDSMRIAYSISLT